MLFLSCGILNAAEKLEKAIENSADYIVQNSSSGSIIAIVNIKSDSRTLSEYIIEKMPDYLVNRKRLTVVDRNRLDIIQREIKFQYSGDVSDETMVSIGKMTGIFISRGNISMLSVKK